MIINAGLMMLDIFGRDDENREKIKGLLKHILNNKLDINSFLYHDRN